MIIIQLTEQSFEYDVYSLVKAFFPGEEVRTVQEAPGESDGAVSLWLVLSFLYVPEPLAEGQNGGQEALAFRAGERDGAAVPPAFRTWESNTLRAELLDGERRLLKAEQVPVRYPADRKGTKNALKRLVYGLLCASAGRTLPWGDLTGIRPTKIPMKLLGEGRREEEILSYMEETYLCSRQKAELATEIAKRERRILEGLNYERGYSLYVGIPFCPSICLYCSFSSSPLSLWKNQVDRYLDALCHEIRFASEEFADRELNTVYIGGGTPTTLEPPQMDRLLTGLEQRFDYSHLKEFTVEAGRPDSITREKLQVLRDHGVTRISINPQTMNQRTLDLIGRRHRVEETVEAFHLAREMGFDNINMDLIVGLPGEGKEEVEHTLQEILLLGPDSLTVHSLALKRASRLSQLMEEYRDSSFTNSAQIMDMAAGYAAAMGQSPYYLYRQKNMAGNFENVGYAREGKAGIYNILIMEEVQSILALGAGGSTKLVWPDGRIQRIENVKDIKSYLERIDEMIERKRRGIHG